MPGLVASADVYMTLDAYLDIVVPRVASIRWASVLELREGINVLDSTDQFERSWKLTLM